MDSGNNNTNNGEKQERIDMESYFDIQSFDKASCGKRIFTFALQKIYIAYDTGIRFSVKGLISTKRSEAQKLYKYVSLACMCDIENTFKTLKDLHRKEITEGILGEREIECFQTYGAAKKISSIHLASKGFIIKAQSQIEEALKEFFDDDKIGENISNLTLKKNATNNQDYLITCLSPDETTESSRKGLLQKKQQVADRRLQQQQDYYDCTFFVGKNQICAKGEEAETHATAWIMRMQQIFNQQKQGAEHIKMQDQIFESQCGKYFGILVSIPRLGLMDTESQRTFCARFQQMKLAFRVQMSEQGLVEKIIFSLEKVQLFSHKMELFLIHDNQQGGMVKGLVRGVRQINISNSSNVSNSSNSSSFPNSFAAKQQQQNQQIKGNPTSDDEGDDGERFEEDETVLKSSSLQQHLKPSIQQDQLTKIVKMSAMAKEKQRAEFGDDYYQEEEEQ